MSIPTLLKSGSQITVSKIRDNQFLIGGNIKSAKFGFEVDPSMISFADIEDGPYLQTGKDFFGKGKIKSIEMLNTNNDNLILKLTLNNNEKTN